MKVTEAMTVDVTSKDKRVDHKVNKGRSGSYGIGWLLRGGLSSKKRKVQI